MKVKWADKGKAVCIREYLLMANLLSIQAIKLYFKNGAKSVIKQIASLTIAKKFQS